MLCLRACCCRCQYCLCPHDVLQQYNIPLEKEGACEMFRKLALATAKLESRPINVGRWNGGRNSDGTTSGHRSTEIVCGNHFFNRFLQRYPCVRQYRTSTMSIMRAKKATPEVYVWGRCCCLYCQCCCHYRWLFSCH